MKRCISILLVLALALSLGPLSLAAEAETPAQPSKQRITVNGAPASLNACNIGGYNFVSLEALAVALAGTVKRFAVSAEPESGAAVLRPGIKSDTEAPALPADLSGGVKSVRALRVGNSGAELEVWTLGGTDYYRLTDLANLLDLNLSYDPAANAVALTAPVTPDRMPEAAKDYAAVYAHIEKGGNYVINRYRGVDEELLTYGVAEAEDAPMAVPDAAAPEPVGTGGWSGTNVQVRGVDEGDIVKTDGRYLYVLNGDHSLTIVRADGDRSAVVSQTDLNPLEKDGFYSGWLTPVEMYVDGDRLAVISEYSDYTFYATGADADEATAYNWWNTRDCCRVDLYDVSNPAKPKHLARLGQDGGLLSSRMLDGRLYLVSRFWTFASEEDDPEGYIPVLYRNDRHFLMEPGEIYLCGVGSSAHLVATAYDLSAGDVLGGVSLLGGGDEIYMSKDSLYVLTTAWDEEELSSYKESVYDVTEYRDGVSTDIYRLDLTENGLSLSAAGRVPGAIDGQFSVDEYEGYLRIVTTRDDSTYRVYEDRNFEFRNYRWDDSSSDNGLYVLDRDLELIGSVTGLAEGERVYSVRFEGDTAWFCTFRTVDPLFTVDLSDPTNPKVLGALKLSGFSEYLHNWTDGRLFGFGREADENTGWADGLKLVMFDASDRTDVKVEKTLHLPELSYSEALYDHKAIFIAPEKNLIGFQADDQYFLYSYDGQNGFRKLCDFSLDDWQLRGFYIGDWTYIAGSETLVPVDMKNWTPARTVDISAPVAVG